MKEETRELLARKNLRVGLCGHGLKAIKNLNSFLRLDGADYRWAILPDNYDLYVGWGNKPSGRRAVRLAEKHQKPFLLLEDAFIRSYAPQSVSGEQPLGLVLDDEGIYYDASRPSRLERLIIEASGNETAAQEGRQIIDLLRRLKICKYNNFVPTLPASIAQIENASGILVVDQTWKDYSVAGAGADEKSFRSMLEAAIDENPCKKIIVKLHPEVMAGKKRGYLMDLTDRSGCTLLSENVNPWDLFDHVGKIYTVSSQLGFDALMAGVDIRCFGLPFYAGWGLTRDELICTRRHDHTPTVGMIACAAYKHYVRYSAEYDCYPHNAARAVCEIAKKRGANMLL